MRRLQLKARYAYDRERREHSVKEDDSDMMVSPSEIYFPYTFGDQSITPPDAGPQETSTPLANGRSLEPLGAHQRNGFTNAYDTGMHPHSAWEDLLTNNLPHMPGRPF